MLAVASSHWFLLPFFAMFVDGSWHVGACDCGHVFLDTWLMHIKATANHGCPVPVVCVMQAAPWLMSQGVQLVCLGTGSTDLEVSGPGLVGPTV